MFCAFYFTLLTSLASTSPPPELWPTLRDARIASATAGLSRRLDASENEECAWTWLQLQADFQMSMGLDIDAEDSYRRLRKRTPASKDELRILSSRNTGWQALFRRRFGTAMGCFSRVADESCIDPRRRIEGLFGVMCVLFELAHLREADKVLDEIEFHVNTLTDQSDNVEAWQEMVQTIRADLATQRALRFAPQLSDHVFWHSGLLGEPGLLMPVKPALARHHAQRKSAVSSPVLRGRLEFTDALSRLAAGQRDAIDILTGHLEWATANGLATYQRAARQEIALAGLAGDAPKVTETVLAPLAGEIRMTHEHRQLELLYCMAKTRQAQGRTQDFRLFYSRYALTAMHCLRVASTALAQDGHNRRRPNVLDEVAARLPAKYRRAYQYLLDNLERSDLSVREVAAEIGVTERALQSVFKSSLGATPSEIIRQQRMKRIHSDLQGDGMDHGQRVLDVANKWGIPNRSRLVSAYKLQFNEVPSETVKR
jgi:AraC-like DNA-binding protein